MANILCTYSLTIRFFSLLKNWNKKNLIAVYACINAFHSEHIQDYLIYPYFITKGTYKCNLFFILLLIHSFLFHIHNYHCVNESHSLDIFRITSFTWISHDHSIIYSISLLLSHSQKEVLFIMIGLLFSSYPRDYFLFTPYFIIFSLFRIHFHQMLLINQ